MTSEEAIKKLENFAKHIEPNEEFLMAIKALKQADGDLISRESVITMLNKIENAVEDGDGFQFNEWIDYAKDIPSAEKTAEWISFDEEANAYECSNCKDAFILMADTPKENNYNYCPNCGAKMKEGEEE